MSTAYTEDFNRWIQQTAQCLRERRWQEVDVDHLIEEIEDLGKAERRSIASQLTRLLLHLLQWHVVPRIKSTGYGHVCRLPTPGLT